MEKDDLLAAMRIGTESVFKEAGKNGDIAAFPMDKEDADDASDFNMPPNAHDGRFDWAHQFDSFQQNEDHHFVGLSYDNMLFCAAHMHVTGKVIDLRLLASDFYEDAPWRGLTLPSVFAGIKAAGWINDGNAQLNFWVTQPADGIISKYIETAQSAKMELISYNEYVLKFKV